MGAADRDAHFKYWLHTQGYTFNGPATMYGLMFPELRTLRAGYEVEQELQEDAESGVSQSDRAGLQEFNEKHGGAGGGANDGPPGGRTR